VAITVYYSEPEVDPDLDDQEKMALLDGETDSMFDPHERSVVNGTMSTQSASNLMLRRSREEGEYRIRYSDASLDPSLRTPSRSSSEYFSKNSDYYSSNSSSVSGNNVEDLYVDLGDEEI